MVYRLVLLGILLFTMTLSPIFDSFVFASSPVITVNTPSRSDLSDTDVTVTLTINDPDGIQSVKYQLTKIPSPLTSSWQTAGVVSSPTTYSFDVLVNAHGTWYLHVLVADTLGNETDGTYGKYVHYDIADASFDFDLFSMIYPTLYDDDPSDPVDSVNTKYKSNYVSALSMYSVDRGGVLTKSDCLAVISAVNAIEAYRDLPQPVDGSDSTRTVASARSSLLASGTLRTELTSLVTNPSTSGGFVDLSLSSSDSSSVIDTSGGLSFILTNVVGTNNISGSGAGNKILVKSISDYSTIKNWW